MLSLFMWLLATSVALSCIAIFTTVKLRQRISHDVEATFPTEKEHGYTDSDLASSSVDGELDTAKSGVPDAVTQSDVQRGPWVLRMTSHVFGERHKGRHSVVVINKRHRVSFQSRKCGGKALDQILQLEKAMGRRLFGGGFP